MSDDEIGEVRSYGCSYACGNPYDFIVTPVQDPTSTLMLCTPCFIRTAHDMVQGFVAADAEVMARAAEVGMLEQVPMNGPGPKRGRKNAPADLADVNAIEEFEGLDLDAE